MLTLNVRGLGSEKKRRAINENYRNKCDILLIQETHSCKDIEQLWKNEWGGKIYYSHGTTSSRGVMTCFNPKFQCKIIKEIHGEGILEGRFLGTEIEVDGVCFSIFNIYAPNADCPEYFHNMELKIREAQTNIIIIGDFNLTLNNDLDRLGTASNNSRAKQVLEGIIEEYSLNEIWRDTHEGIKEYSWIKNMNTESLKASRIDFCLTTSIVTKWVYDCFYLNGVYTDHRALVVIINIMNKERGPGYWKLNSSLLYNPEYTDKITVLLLKDIKLSVNMEDKSRWEWLKKKIKIYTQNFARAKSNEENLVISQLSEIVTNLQACLPLPEHDTQLLVKSKQDLEDLLNKKVEGIIFQSKSRWYAEGERSTKYFLNLEKNRAGAKSCLSPYDDQNQLQTDPDKIMRIQCSFYQELYSESSEVKFSLKNEHNMTIPEELKDEENFCIQELDEVVTTMAKNKSPGPDGICAEFYQKFWNLLRTPLYNALCKSFKYEELFDSGREGILNLIPKPNKDCRFIKNLRPITLLNVDYKMLEKMIANRLLPMPQSIISCDQRGFLPDRRISINIRKMLDVMEHVKRQEKEALIINCDFLKAFDKVNLNSLFEVMKYFQIPNILIKWTKIIYTNFTVKIQNNSFLSQKIDIKQGLHQGGPSSSLYFLLIAEILAICLKSNKEIKGIHIDSVLNLLNQFADDLDITSEADENSVKQIFKTFDMVYVQTGLKINYDKTTIYRVGSLRHSCARMYTVTDNIKWTNESINVLGVDICHDNILEINYNNTLSKTKSILNGWKNRGLSLIGKVTIINTLISSLFVYKMLVLQSITPQRF